VVPVCEGGATSAANGQGLCQACNLAKQAPGWSARAGPGGAGDAVVVTTPTGHRCTGTAPAPPGGPVARGRPAGSDLEEILRRMLDDAA
jgi:hypothetical protein